MFTSINNGIIKLIAHRILFDFFHKVAFWDLPLPQKVLWLLYITVTYFSEFSLISSWKHPAVHPPAWYSNRKGQDSDYLSHQHLLPLKAVTEQICHLRIKRAHHL